jgi:hypothetical protein
MTLLTQLAELAIVGWLPGAALFRLPWWERDRRAALAAEERLFWAVLLSVSISVALVLALAALNRYAFERLLLGDLAIAAAALVASRSHVRLGSAARRPGWTALLPLVLAAMCAWRFFPSAEYIGGGKDPGTYMNEGIQVAQRGSLVVRDPVIASIPPFTRALFLPSHERPDYYGLRFMGFYVRNPDDGTVVGQFFHAFPASIAIGYGIDGLSGARRTVGAWGLLGVLAVYFAGARLVGPRAAAVAAALLALHVIQTWFARYPNAEVMIQAMLFAALLAGARATIDGDRFFAPVAGFLLGLLLFVRYDSILAVAGVAAGLLLALFHRKRPHWSLLAVLAVCALFAAAYYLGPMRAYVTLPLVFARNLAWPHLLLLGAAAAGALAALFIGSRRPAAGAYAVLLIPPVVTAAVAALAIYALFLRHPEGRLAAHDAYAFRTFTSLYFTLPAMLAALVGFAIVVGRSFWRDPALIMTVVVFSVFLFYKIRIHAEHFWMARRFLPVILPGALLFVAAAALSRGQGRWPGARLLRPLIGLVFVALLGAHYSRVSAPLLAHVEYEGLIPRIEKLAAAIGDDDLLIVESRDAGSDVHVLATPLAYIYARNVLLLHSAKPDKPALATFLDWARTRYTRVLFLGGGGTDLLSHRYDLEPLASDRFQVPEYEATTNRLPRGARRKEFDYGVYRFTPPGPRDGVSFELDVGTRDDLHMVRFHAKEQTDGTTFRWTGRLSFITVTVIPASARAVTLWMSNGGRPASTTPADVEVSLHNQVLGRVRVSGGFNAYSLSIPPELAGRAASAGDPVELRLRTPTWNPERTLGTADDRDLGVMVDRVQVR